MNYKKIFFILDRFVPKKKIWGFLCQPGDITNAIAMWEYLINNKLYIKHKVVPIWIGTLKQKSFIINRFGEKTLFYKRKSIKGLFNLLFSELAFITHGPTLFLKSKRRKIINLWHGLSIKNIGLLHKNQKKK